MVIMEIKDNREKMSEYTEKVLRYAGKLMQLIDDEDWETRHKSHSNEDEE